MLHFFLRHYFPTENTILWRVRSRTAQTADIYHARKTKKKKKRQYVWLKASRLTSCRCIAHFGKSSLICTYFIHLCEICAFCASSARVNCETIESECHKKFARKTFETLITTCLCEREKNESLQKISISKENKSFIFAPTDTECAWYFLTYDVRVRTERKEPALSSSTSLNKIARMKLSSFSEYEYFSVATH